MAIRDSLQSMMAASRSAVVSSAVVASGAKFCLPTNMVDFRDLMGKMATAALVREVLTDERLVQGLPSNTGGQILTRVMLEADACVRCAKKGGRC